MAKLEQLENRQEQLRIDLRNCGLREFNDLYFESLKIDRQIKILQGELS